MIIYLVRHGEAVPAEADPARPLNAKGLAEVEETAKGLRDQGAKVEEIWHSGKLRAKQTAEIIARVLGVEKVLEKPGLKPDDPVEPIAEILRQASSGSDARLVARNASRVTQDALRNASRSRSTHNAPRSVLIAGHLPFIPKLASLFQPDLGTIELKSGGVVRCKL